MKSVYEEKFMRVGQVYNCAIKFKTSVTSLHDTNHPGQNTRDMVHCWHKVRIKGFFFPEFTHWFTDGENALQSMRTISKNRSAIFPGLNSFV